MLDFKATVDGQPSHTIRTLSATTLCFIYLNGVANHLKCLKELKDQTTDLSTVPIKTDLSGKCGFRAGGDPICMFHTQQAFKRTIRRSDGLEWQWTTF